MRRNPLLPYRQQVMALVMSSSARGPPIGVSRTMGV